MLLIERIETTRLYRFSTNTELLNLLSLMGLTQQIGIKFGGTSNKKFVGSFSSEILWQKKIYYFCIYFNALLTGRDAFVSERLSILTTLTYTSDVFAATNGRTMNIE